MSTPDPVLATKAFSKISDLAKRECGLILGDEKRMMVQSRLRSRLKALNIYCFNQYAELVASENGSHERSKMISALTTNVSHFFREAHHLDMMISKIGKSIAAKIRNNERIRIWSAGCSTGQEPYSIAMHLVDEFPMLHKADFKILATDIDRNVLESAFKGSYSQREISSIPKEMQDAYIKHSNDDSCFLVSNSLKKHITFKRLNLLAEWPMRNVFDAIFCRNVVIYFDGETQMSLWPRFVRIMHSQTVLFLGHSERITEPERVGLTPIGHTSYVKN